MTAAQALDAYEATARRRGVRTQVFVVRSTAQEVVARGGRVERSGTASEARVAARVSQHGRTVSVSASASADPELVLGNAVRALRHVRASELPAPVARERPADCERGSWLAAEQLERAAVAATVADEPGELELRCRQEARRVELGGTDEPRSAYSTSEASALFRATASEDGRTGHAEYADFGRSLEELLARADLRLRATTHARLFLTTARPQLPSRVVLYGHVAARLLAFAAVSLQADAVAQRRSRLAGCLGEAVCSESVTLVDDPMAPDGPLNAPFDDEGTPTGRRVLVSAGLLRGYLADRRFAGIVEGARPGSAWRASLAAPPRVRPSNLLLEPGWAPLDVHPPYLRVVQAYGLHTANEVTGDFSMGAAGLVETAGGCTGVTGLTVAGNVFEVLCRVDQVGSTIGWARARGAYFGSPDLSVGGLAVGSG